MFVHTLRREQVIPRPIDEVFPFFADAANLETITPSWLNFRILTPPPIAMRAGIQLDYRLKWHGIPISWKTEILAWNPSHSFTDIQLRGPYTLWHHVHTFFPDPRGTRMVDVVNYRLPLGPLGELAYAVLVRRDLERVFEYRCRVIEKLFSPQDTGAGR